ncbi:MAG: quinolinate synthase NadA [Desulfuromonadaceae bacterium]|nr:quinolinate synthase NadA [Desulfuromonadaceae bacterium]
MVDYTEQIERIRSLAQEKDVLILAHNYLSDEIQALADITGDSLALSVAAAATDKSTILFCGVHFMAESAAILAPEKTVLLPNMKAGCPMADMVTPEGVAKMRQLHPGAPVVAYVNTTAATKAASDICCTSANAVKVVNSLPEAEVILIPDRNLGSYIASKVDKICHLWDGCCPVHDELSADAIRTCRERHPEAICLAHPECTPEVLEQVDHVLSTGGMLEFVRQSAHPSFIIATERGIACQLRKENPEKTFIFPDYEFICEDMKRVSIDDVERSLNTFEHRISVSEEIRVKAQRALERMLAIPRD